VRQPFLKKYVCPAALLWALSASTALYAQVENRTDTTIARQVELE
jgi:hypothetical protein